MKRIMALLTLGIVLMGCGQKGGLYVPESTAPATTEGMQSPDSGTGGY